MAENLEATFTSPSTGVSIPLAGTFSDPALKQALERSLKKTQEAEAAERDRKAAEARFKETEGAQRTADVKRQSEFDGERAARAQREFQILNQRAFEEKQAARIAARTAEKATAEAEGSALATQETQEQARLRAENRNRSINDFAKVAGQLTALIPQLPVLPEDQSPQQGNLQTPRQVATALREALSGGDLPAARALIDAAGPKLTELLQTQDQNLIAALGISGLIGEVDPDRIRKGISDLAGVLGSLSATFTRDPEVVNAELAQNAARTTMTGFASDSRSKTIGLETLANTGSRFTPQELAGFRQELEQDPTKPIFVNLESGGEIFRLVPGDASPFQAPAQVTPRAPGETVPSASSRGGDQVITESTPATRDTGLSTNEPAFGQFQASPFTEPVEGFAAPGQVADPVQEQERNRVLQLFDAALANGGQADPTLVGPPERGGLPDFPGNPNRRAAVGNVVSQVGSALAGLAERGVNASLFQPALDFENLIRRLPAEFNQPSDPALVAQRAESRLAPSLEGIQGLGDSFLSPLANLSLPSISDLPRAPSTESRRRVLVQQLRRRGVPLDEAEAQAAQAIP